MTRQQPPISIGKVLSLARKGGIKVEKILFPAVKDFFVYLIINNKKNV